MKRFLLILIIAVGCKISDPKKEALARQAQIKIEGKAFLDSMNKAIAIDPGLNNDKEFMRYATKRVNEFAYEFKELNKQLGVKDSIELMK